VLDFTRASPVRSPAGVISRDSSGAPTRPVPRRASVAALALVLVLSVLCGLRAAPARADGDPASDVLTQESLYVPQDAGLSAAQQLQLGKLVADAARAGFPARIALVASPTDLGSITELFRQPQSYAKFLGLELSLQFHGPLVVVMPNGIGVHGISLTPAVTRVIDGLAGGGAHVADLGPAAIAAISKLAAAAGHPVAVPTLATTRSAPGSSDPVALVVWVLGALLILVAFAASFRARPVRLGRGPAAAQPPM
jgi:hypothetical protein